MSNFARFSSVVDKNIPVVFVATKEGYGKVTKTVYLNKLTLEEAGD